MTFNPGILALCALAGAAVFQAVNAALLSATAGLGDSGVAGLTRLVMAGAAASAVYFAVNVGLIGLLVGLRSGRPWYRAWAWPLMVSPSLIWNYLALGLLGDLLVAMERVGGVVGLGLALIPLAVTYFSLRQNAATSRLYDAVVATLADSLDLRDHDTGGHTRRTAALAVRLGQRLGLRGQALADLRTAALLHDLGKIGVADAILLKPAELTGGEWAAMRRHPELGAELLAAHGLLAGAVPMIRHHQEHYDGSGYPGGLVGAAIPLGARIIAVADAFMAMVDGRPYRAGIAPDAAWRELQHNAARQFDPQVVAALQPDDWQTVLADMPRVERQLVRA
jgi:HD-GYP domain-containing protein (c-di-GMP phosphodiesterase class II)